MCDGNLKYLVVKINLLKEYMYIYIYIYIYKHTHTHMWHVWRKGELCTSCWWGNLREIDHWGE
jgi:hypothetical protein